MKRPMIEDVSMIGVGVSLSPELGSLSVTVVADEFASSVKSTKLRTKYILTINNRFFLKLVYTFVNIADYL